MNSEEDKGRRLLNKWKTRSTPIQVSFVGEAGMSAAVPVAFTTLVIVVAVEAGNVLLRSADERSSVFLELSLNRFDEVVDEDDLRTVAFDFDDLTESIALSSISGRCSLSALPPDSGCVRGTVN